MYKNKNMLYIIKKIDDILHFRCYCYYRQRRILVYCWPHYLEGDFVPRDHFQPITVDVCGRPAGRVLVITKKTL